MRFDTLRVGLSEVDVVWVLSWPTTPIPGVWETMRVYHSQDAALDAQECLYDWAEMAHGIHIESTVQPAPVSERMIEYPPEMERAYSHRPFDGYSRKV